MDSRQRIELEALHKQLVDSMDKLSPVRQIDREKDIADIKQLLIADNALRAGDQKLFNKIMASPDYGGGGC